MQRSEIMFQGNTTFSNNTASYGGAIQAIEANVNVTGNVDFTKNLATVNGGALALDGDSVVYIFETAFLTFVENRADSLGGAIYIEDDSVHCSYDWKNNIGFLSTSLLADYDCNDLLTCYASIASILRISISFSGNSAVAGSAIFGGAIDEITSHDVAVRGIERSQVGVLVALYPSPTVAELLFDFFSANIDGTDNGSAISSPYLWMCQWPTRLQ